MAKKSTDRHKVARKVIQMPEDWHQVAESLATEGQTPTLWLLISLIKKEAESRGIKNLPPVPWGKRLPPPE